MTTRLGYLAEVVVDLEPDDVQAFSFAVETDWHDVDHRRSMQGIAVRVHVDTYEDAERLAARWQLFERDDQIRFSESTSGAPMVWRTWSGWVSDLSRDCPVSMEVVAGEEEELTLVIGA